MIRHDESDIIGTARHKKADLGPLFDQPDVAEAAAELREQFVAPVPRAREETQAFTAPKPLTDREVEDARERIRRAVREPLVALALERKDVMDKDRIGVTAGDVRAIAEAKGLGHLLGHEQRAWSWLSGWLSGLCYEKELVRYRVHGQTVLRTNASGNDLVIYLHPYDHRARGAA